MESDSTALKDDGWRKGVLDYGTYESIPHTLTFARNQTHDKAINISKRMLQGEARYFPSCKWNASFHGGLRLQ